MSKRDEIVSETQGFFFGNIIWEKFCGKKDNRKNRKLKYIRIKNRLRETLFRSYADQGITPTKLRVKDDILYYNLRFIVPVVPENIIINISITPEGSISEGST